MELKKHGQTKKMLECQVLNVILVTKSFWLSIYPFVFATVQFAGPKSNNASQDSAMAAEPDETPMDVSAPAQQRNNPTTNADGVAVRGDDAMDVNPVIHPPQSRIL